MWFKLYWSNNSDQFIEDFTLPTYSGWTPNGNFYASYTLVPGTFWTLTKHVCLVPMSFSFLFSPPPHLVWTTANHFSSPHHHFVPKTHSWLPTMSTPAPQPCISMLCPSTCTVTGTPNANVVSQLSADMNNTGALMLPMPSHSQDSGYPPPILMIEKSGTCVHPSSIMGEDLYFHFYLYIMYYYYGLVLSKMFRHFSWVAAEAWWQSRSSSSYIPWWRYHLSFCAWLSCIQLSQIQIQLWLVHPSSSCLTGGVFWGRALGNAINIGDAVAIWEEMDIFREGLAQKPVKGKIHLYISKP